MTDNTASLIYKAVFSLKAIAAGNPFLRMHDDYFPRMLPFQNCKQPRFRCYLTHPFRSRTIPSLWRLYSSQNKRHGQRSMAPRHVTPLCKYIKRPDHPPSDSCPASQDVTVYIYSPLRCWKLSTWEPPRKMPSQLPNGRWRHSIGSSSKRARICVKGIRHLHEDLLDLPCSCLNTEMCCGSSCDVYWKLCYVQPEISSWDWAPSTFGLELCSCVCCW